MAKQFLIACDDLRQLYEQQFMTTVQLAAHYGCSITTIAKRLHECGATLRSSRFQPRPIPPDELRRLYMEAQLPVIAIAAHFGVCASTIYNRCRAHGLPRRRQKATDS